MAYEVQVYDGEKNNRPADPIRGMINTHILWEGLNSQAVCVEHTLAGVALSVDGKRVFIPVELLPTVVRDLQRAF